MYRYFTYQDGEMFFLSLMMIQRRLLHSAHSATTLSSHVLRVEGFDRYESGVGELP
jgi:hypothetical protein